tara:strand:+ start:6993 stop:7433 length:441 start_codon:yes stop_codon:yes gene_type:complete
MKLLIMRHGEATPLVDIDANRALTNRGHAEARSAVESVVERGERPQILFVSPYLRAQQTAAEVQCLVPEIELVTIDCLIPEASPADLITFLEKSTETNIILVSHQPLVSLLIGYLTGQQIYMGTASVALIESDIWAKQQGELKWVI